MEVMKELDIKSRQKSLICKTGRGDPSPKGCISGKSPPSDLRSVFGMVQKEAARGGPFSIPLRGTVGADGGPFQLQRKQSRHQL